MILNFFKSNSMISLYLIFNISIWIYMSLMEKLIIEERTQLNKELDSINKDGE